MKGTTLYDLRKSYAQETAALRRRYLDAVQGKDWHATTDALLHGRLGTSRKPRGEAFDRLVRINNKRAAARFFRGGKLRDEKE